MSRVWNTFHFAIDLKSRFNGRSTCEWQLYPQGPLGATLIGPSAPTRFWVGKIGANQVWKVLRAASYEIRRRTFGKSSENPLSETSRPLATSSPAVGREAVKQGSLRSPRGRLVASLVLRVVGQGLRCFDTVFQRPYWYFSIALKVIFSLSDRLSDRSFTNDWP